MNINLLLIILIALGIWRAVRGFKTGLAAVSYTHLTLPTTPYV